MFFVQRAIARSFSTANSFPSKSRIKYSARSWFFPKKTRAGIEKTRTLGADAVILDLEDSVAAEEKSSIRKEYIKALDDGVLTGMRVFVRVSDLDATHEVEEDIRALTRPDITGFLLPKVKHADQVKQVDDILTKVEKELNLEQSAAKLVPILEVPEAYFHSDTISSCSPRNICVIVGSGDFTAAAVCDDHSPTYDAFFSRGVMSAKAAGIEAVCGVHDKIDDHAGLERFCIKMKKCGYVGGVALTPKQIQIINNAFVYTPREMTWVDEVLNENGGTNNIKLIQPSVQESRQMIGPPHKEKATAMKERYETQNRHFVRPQITAHSPTIRGTQMKKGISSKVRLGEIVQTPFEVTVTDSWKSLWETAFLGTKGYFSSLPRSARLGFESLPLPFSLAATMGVAFSVSSLSYYARVHLCFRNMFQQRPLMAGDTVKAIFCINSTEKKKGGDGSQYCIAHSTHWLVNQREEVVFQVNKTTMFSPSHCNIQSTEASQTVGLDPVRSIHRQRLMQQPECVFLPHLPLPKLTPGQLLVHDFVKIMGESEVRMLCTLLNIVNPHHHNKIRYQATDLLVPGPFVMSAALGSSALDIGEIVYEDIPLCVNPNKVNFGDQVGAITYIESCEPLPDNPMLEEVKVKHLALKNTDMEVLSEMDIPTKLFEATVMKPSEYESVCAAEFPMLLHKIACVFERRIVRVRPGFANESEIPNELLL